METCLVFDPRTFIRLQGPLGGDTFKGSKSQSTREGGSLAFEAHTPVRTSGLSVT